MRHISTVRPEPLYGVEATRAIELATARSLPPHALMARAGQSVAELTRALAPHAQRIWIACGPGNNGGDGLVAAAHLQRWSQSIGGGRTITVSLCAAPDRLPPDAAHALVQARTAGVNIQATPPSDFDFAVDALLGIGCRRAPEGVVAEHLKILRSCPAPVLCIDLPSGLDTDTGVFLGAEEGCLVAEQERHTLSLLTLKPGLFTAAGRDQAGDIWFDDLGVQAQHDTQVDALLSGFTQGAIRRPRRAHASHKGSYGEVVVLGGQDIAHTGTGMTGAAVLAARAALHSGTGRVYVALLGEVPGAPAVRWDPACPELMFRSVEFLLDSALMRQASVVCGCGGGDAVVGILPVVLSRAPALVLDADALNAIASDRQLQTLLRQRSARGWTTVLTPHPLEAARLLETGTPQVMADRLAAARQLSERFGAICVLKGSGTVISAPGQVPLINASGNAALATAGTGDVLAGMIGSALATQTGSQQAHVQRVAAAVFQHARLADRWDQIHPDTATAPLTASALAQRAGTPV